LRHRQQEPAVIDISLACGRYDRTEALRDGRVTPEGVRLTYIALEAEEAFFRMLEQSEFDTAEMSLGSYVSRRGRGAADVVAIPVFPSRMFRHAAIYVPATSKIEDPRDLVDGRVGVPEYRMTAAIWVRGLLQDEFGVAPGDVRWVTGGLEQPGRRPIEATDPPGVEIARVDDASLDDLLRAGAIDALISPRVPSSVREGAARRLFADPSALDREFYRRSRVFPIMHVVVVQASLLEAHPWVARSLVKAFAAAKALALPELFDESALRTMLPFQLDHAREMLELMGPDPWPEGVGPNEPALSMFLAMAKTQGLVPQSLRLEDLFAPSTLEHFRI
jgi:4,5-dihydroxyphthalate decarboxylase